MYPPAPTCEAGFIHGRSSLTRAFSTTPYQTRIAAILRSTGRQVRGLQLTAQATVTLIHPNLSVSLTCHRDRNRYSIMPSVVSRQHPRPRSAHKGLVSLGF